MSKPLATLNEVVVVVDDEQEIGQLYVEAISPTGLRVVAFDDASDALAFIEKGEPVLMVFSDFRMPGMDGLQFCARLRTKFPKLPFLLSSAFVDKSVAVASVKTQVTDVLEKPFSIAAIQDVALHYARARLDAIETRERETLEITGIFVEEAKGLLEDLERHILRLEEEPLDSAVVDVLFRSAHSIKGGASALPGGEQLASLSHAFESCLSQVKQRAVKVDPTSVELFLFTSDLCQKLTQHLAQAQPPSGDLSAAVTVCIQSLEAVKAGSVVPELPKQLAESAPLESPTAEKTVTENEGVWVTNDKLDSFMKLSGELIVLKDYFQVLNQEPELISASARVSGKMTDFSYSLNKITDSLQDQIMSIRKITLDRALSKLPRIFRQVTDETGKSARLETEGFELGVDRTIANALSASMTHMVRNAIDHGLENEAVRSAAGKTADGTVTIRAREQKGTIYVTIADDGAGIDRKRVVEKAVERGLIDEGKASRLTDEEAYDLLFLPGFSTAEKVTGISGRGVGMDVVKTEIINLKGRIRIESERGRGTAFHLEVPVPKTVMVEQTVLVKSDDTLIAVPLNAIAQLTTAGAIERTMVGRQMTCQYQGRTVPLKSYADLADPSDDAPVSAAPSEAAVRTKPIVILQHKNDLVGLLVDSIHDQLEAVIRPFDRVTQHFAGFKGTTVLGDDSIAYVIAPEEFVSLGLRKEPA